MTKCSGFVLKIMAIISMLVDHIAVILVLPAWDRGITDASIGNTGLEVLMYLYVIMRIIGRIAFPIFAFLLVEGYLHTGNLWKYAARLLAFAGISEIPFDLGFRDSWWDISHNNVFFTLLAGLVTIIIIGEIEQRLSEAKLISLAVKVLVTLAMMALAQYGLHSDYGAVGVGAIVTLYIMRNYRDVAVTAAVLVLAYQVGIIELAGILALVPIHCYSGERGRSMKYFFYIFYPAHILLLTVIASLIQ